MRRCKAELSAAILAIGLLAAGCSQGAANPAQVSKSTVRWAEALEQEDTRAQIKVPEAVAQEQEGQAKSGEEPSGQALTSQEEAVQGSMVPVYGTELRNGVYPIRVDSSSGMFQITACELTVRDGSMSAVMTMGGTGYLKLFMGTGEEAARAGDRDFIPYAETGEGTHTFTVPVKALDQRTDCSAFSKKKEKWYDRVLVFRSDSLPMDAFLQDKITTAESLKLKDGMYTVEVKLEGGSGRSAVESPAGLRVEGGRAYATIVWGSSNYDYMKVNDERFELIHPEGNSAFEIPVPGFDWKMPVIADTIAMSQPHEISYTLFFDSSTLKRAE